MYIGGASSVEFNQVEFFDNVATYGAAAAVTGASSAKFDGCSMFNHNSANYGTILASDASFIVFRGDLNHMIAGFPSGLVATMAASSVSAQADDALAFEETVGGAVIVGVELGAGAHEKPVQSAPQAVHVHDSAKPETPKK